ncbi:MAG: DUF3153 domain-containing protein [Cyanobacteriota bacterium]
MRRLLSLLLLCLCLTGCIQYDVGITYDSQTHGELVQRIRLDGQIPAARRSTARAWLEGLEQQARNLGGKVRHPSKQESLITIPFNNGKDLAAKFNRFFNPSQEERRQLWGSDLAELPAIGAQLTIRENNLLLVQRNRLTLDLDLRSLAVRGADGRLLVSPGGLLDIDFRLNTPWGLRRVDGTPAPELDDRRAFPKENRQLTWSLQPGELNHLEAVFWVPSPLGLGTVAIAAIVGIGTLIKALLEGNGDGLG